jgi:F-type H+-transporting ATPase subunit gamma
MKITRAMELIAASRIVKAQARVQAARPYAHLLTRAMEDVARQTGQLAHPLLEDRPNPEHAGLLVITADRGLAGAYSSNVLRLAERTIRRIREHSGGDVRLYVTGKKGVSYFRFRGAPITAEWIGFSEVPTYSAAEEVGRRLIGDFRDHEIDELHAVYTDFRSAFTFRAATKRLLPIAPEEVVSGEQGRPHPEYIFEPSPAAILDELLPQYVITEVYFAMLESAASENAARQRAMAAATDNAEELMKVLTREANQARQAEITTEIMEIVGGAEALASAAARE